MFRNVHWFVTTFLSTVGGGGLFLIACMGYYRGMQFVISQEPFCFPLFRGLNVYSLLSLRLHHVGLNFLQKYDIEFLLQQEWYDSRLRYPNQTTFSVLNGIHHQSDIWLPDTNFHMHGDFKPTQRPIRFTLHVYGDGRVEYTTR